MKNIILEDSADHISSAEFNSFISENKLNLPESYRRFILKQNGGYLKNHQFNSNDHSYIISEIYCVKNKINKDALEGLLSSLEVMEDQQINDDLLPEDLYPFASDPGGSTFCISTNSENLGKIYLFYWDGSERAFVCDSFEEFMNGLSKY